MAMIKLLDIRMMMLRSAMKKEAERLQNVANQVARISAGLNMDLKASSGIEESLAKLRKNLKNQSSNWTVMQQLAEQASADLHQKDEELAKQASGLTYTMRQFTQKAQSDILGTPTQNLPSLGLSSWGKLDAAEKLGGLFDSLGSGFGDALRGVSLGDLAVSAEGEHAVETGTVLGATAEMETDLKTSHVIDLLRNFDIVGAASGVMAGAGTAYLVGTHVLASLFDDRANTVIADTSGIVRAVASGDKNKLNDVVDAWIETQKHEALAISKEKAEQLTAETGREHAVDSWGNVYDVQERQEWMAAEKAKDEAWKAEQERLANRNIFEKTWDGMKAVANSKPVEYLGEMGGDAVAMLGDIVSFCGNAGNLPKQGLDVYKTCNDFFEFAQDADALLTYGFGSVFESLGMQDKADEYYATAEEKASREGLADEMHETEWLDGLGYLADLADIGVAGYDMASGIEGMKTATDGMSWTTWDGFKESLHTLSGWKDVETISDAAEVKEKIEHYSDLISNVGTGYKYVDGLSEGFLGEGGLFSAMWGSTMPGKVGGKIIGFGESILKGITRAASDDDDDT